MENIWDGIKGLFVAVLEVNFWTQAAFNDMSVNVP